MKPKGWHYHYGRLEFWAENGSVVLVDKILSADDPDHHKAKQLMSPTEFLRTAMKVYLFQEEPYFDQAANARKMLLEAKQVAKEARDQGDPRIEKNAKYLIDEVRPRQILLASDFRIRPTR